MSYNCTPIFLQRFTDLELLLTFVSSLPLYQIADYQWLGNMLTSIVKFRVCLVGNSKPTKF